MLKYISDFDTDDEKKVSDMKVFLKIFCKENYAINEEIIRCKDHLVDLLIKKKVFSIIILRLILFIWKNALFVMNYSKLIVPMVTKLLDVSKQIVFYMENLSWNAIFAMSNIVKMKMKTAFYVMLNV